MLQWPYFCGLLGNVTVSWSSGSTADPADLQPLTSLTGLTHLSMLHGTNLRDVTEIRHLRQLSSLVLSKLSALPSRRPNLNNLHLLSLSGCQDEIWDFSSCSSLLKLSNFGDNMKQIVLTTGPKVTLQEISVGTTLFRDMHNYVMPMFTNIGKATQFTEVKFMFAYPCNFRGGEWPLHLPDLCNLHRIGMSCDPLSAVTSWPTLRHSAVWDHDQGTLPLWLSSTTQLTHLRIDDGRLEQFPDDIVGALSVKMSDCVKRTNLCAAQSSAGLCLLAKPYIPAHCCWRGNSATGVTAHHVAAGDVDQAM